MPRRYGYLMSAAVSIGHSGNRIMMLSTHGYVGADAELGKPDTGGQVVFVLELAKQFVALGHTVDIVTRRFEGQPRFDDMGERLRVWRIPFGGDDFIRKEDMHDHLDDFVANALAEFAEEQASFDIINSHYWDAGWAGQKIAEELGVAHIHTPHSLGSWKRQEMEGDPQEIESNYRFDERIRKEFLVYRRCDFVIATTSQQAEILQEDYDVPEWHMAMIPPGIDEARYTPISQAEIGQMRRRLGFADHDIYTVGRAAANKGYDLLIEALPYLRNAVPEARLKLAVGANNDSDREMVSKWNAMAEELGIADAIDWIGYVEDDEMADYYRAHGGLEEMFDFGAHALFADPERPQEYGVMLSMPLRYPQLRERLSIAGARFARRHFGWRGIARRTLVVFERESSSRQVSIARELG